MACKTIVVTLVVDEETLMREADCCSTFEEAVSQGLGWLRDSGMTVESWEEKQGEELPDVPLDDEEDGSDDI